MVKCPIHINEVINVDVNDSGYFCYKCQKYYSYGEIYNTLLERYYAKMNEFSDESCSNQLIQECAELIQNITKQNQRRLNGEIIEEKILENYPKELMHVKLIIDYLLFINPCLNAYAKDAFIELCLKRKVIGV